MAYGGYNGYCAIMVAMGLHAFGHLDTQQRGGCAYYACALARQLEAQRAYGGVFFAQDGVVVVELIVHLDYFVDVIGYECGRIRSSGFGHNIGEVGKTLYQ